MKQEPILYLKKSLLNPPFDKETFNKLGTMAEEREEEREQKQQAAARQVQATDQRAAKQATHRLNQKRRKQGLDPV